MLALYHESWAVLHGYRFKQVGDKTVLVLKHDKASVDATPAGDPELSRRLGSPVVAFAEIFRASDGLDALEAASKYHQLSIDITPEGDPALLERQSNLGHL